jgi:uncharacterized membrane protein
MDFFIGGFSGLLIGQLNEGKKKLPVWIMCLIGTTGVFVIEFFTGLVCNVWLDLNIWSYEGWPLNVMEQISLLYAPLWFFLTPFVIWLDDAIRYFLFDEEKPCSLMSYYVKIFKGQK